MLLASFGSALIAKTFRIRITLDSVRPFVDKVTMLPQCKREPDKPTMFLVTSFPCRCNFFIRLVVQNDISEPDSRNPEGVYEIRKIFIVYTNRKYHPVVCLRGDEKGICLEPPLFGVPP